MDTYANTYDYKDTYDQQKFNTNFIIKFVIFFQLYNFYNLHIDPENILVNCIENSLNVD
jgi:hypothetical protein